MFGPLQGGVLDAGQGGPGEPAGPGEGAAPVSSAHPMHALRRTRLFGLSLARLVLVWFVLSVGVAVAAPWVSPKSMDIVCSGSGAAKLGVKTGDGAVGAGALLDAGMDCALCAPTGAPPARLTLTAAPPSPLAHALRPIAQAAHAARVAAPLPARGPPHHA